MKVDTKLARVRIADVMPDAGTIGEEVARQAEAILSTLHTQQRKGDAILEMASRVDVALRGLTRAQRQLERALYNDYLRDE